MNTSILILLGVMVFGITLSVFLARLLFKNSLTFWVGIFFILMVNVTLILSMIEFSENQIVDRLIGLTSIILSALVLMKIFDRLIGKSLRNLTHEIDILSSGKLDINIPKEYMERKSEIGMISCSINEMVTNLKTSVNLAKMVSRGELYLDVEKLNKEGNLDIALNEMVVQLRGISSNIKSAAEHVGAGSNELNISAQSIAQGANEQAAAAEQVASAMEEMSTTNQQNTENAKKADQIAKLVATDIKNVNESITQTATAMKNIAEKISIINDIAEKTDILAINAAIEAARAGESGKGFAVVASEVRELAEHSQKAADEIDVVAKDSMLKVNNSKDLLDKILPEIERSSVLVNEISAATSEQNNGINEVNSGIQQLSSVVQQNSASSEELAASSEELSAQSAQLNKSISFFKVTEKEQKQFSKNEIKSQIDALSKLLQDSENEVSTSIENEKGKKKADVKPLGKGADGINLDMGDKGFDKY